MNDQAAHLRALMSAAPRRPAVMPLEGPPTIVVGSGKGGVGKSVVSVLLAAAVARRGHRVLLFDAAQNLGTLHVLLNVHPAGRPAAVLAGERAPGDLVTHVHETLWLLPADSGAESLHALGGLERARLHQRLVGATDGFDLVVVDAEAGIDPVVRAATIGASRLLVVTMLEPAALTDAYALMKIVHREQPDLPFDVLVNQVRAADDGPAAFERLTTACQQFLGRSIEYAGAFPHEESIRVAVRTASDLLGVAETMPAAQSLASVMTDALGLDGSPVYAAAQAGGER